MSVELDAVKRAEEILRQQQADMRERDKREQARQDEEQRHGGKKREARAPARDHERELDASFRASPKALSAWQSAAGIGAETSGILAAERAEREKIAAPRRQSWKPGERDPAASEPIYEARRATFVSEAEDELTEGEVARGMRDGEDELVAAPKGRAGRSPDDVFEAAARGVSEAMRPARRVVQALYGRARDFARMLGDGIFGGAAAWVRGMKSGLDELSRGRRIRAGLSTWAAASASFFLGAFAMSALATVDLFTRAPSRRLGRRERSCLRAVFGPGIDYDAVRVREMSALLGSTAAAATAGNTLYVQESAWSSGVIPPSVLVKQAVHVWQHQAGRSDLFLQKLLERFAHDTEDSWVRDLHGLSFSRLTAAQQAMLIKTAFERGFFDRQSPSYGAFVYDLTGDGAPFDLGPDMREIAATLRAPRASR